MLYGSAAALTLATLPAIAQRSPNGAGATANAYPAPPANGAVAQNTEWTSFAGGVNVGVNDVNGDGHVDLVVGETAGSGTAGAYDGLTLSPLDPMLPFGAFRAGVFVA